jgi:hypothetical protein
VSYFTLRASLILKGTINDFYKRRIMKAAVADRTPTHGYAETREAAMTGIVVGAIVSFLAR